MIKTTTIRLDNEILKAAKIKSIKTNKSLSEYIASLIDADLKEKSTH